MLSFCLDVKYIALSLFPAFRLLQLESYGLASFNSNYEEFECLESNYKEFEW